MMKIMVALLVVLTLLCSCGAPAETIVPADVTETPEVTEAPVTDEPEVTEPEVTEPEATEPEATEPEATEPAETEPPVVRNDFAINVKEDTYVLNKDSEGDKSGVNYAGENIIDLKSHPGSLTRYGYVKFDVSELVGDNSFTAIDLDLFINWRQADPGNPELAKIEIYGCDADWVATNVTFKNQPASYGLVTSLADITTQKVTRSFSVTDYVRKAIANGKTEIAFFIKEATPEMALRIKLDSSESGGNIPKLSVYYGTKVDNTTYEGGFVAAQAQQPTTGDNTSTPTPTGAIKVVEDTYVEAGTSADKNFGSADVIDFKAISNNTPSAYYRIGLLKFDISSFSGSKATLVLNCETMENTTIPTTVHVYACDPAAWNENTVTFNTIPERGDLINTFVVSAQAAVSVDITDYVKTCKAQGKTTISFYLEGDQDSVRRLKFSSKEGTKLAPYIACE